MPIEQYASRCREVAAWLLSLACVAVVNAEAAGFESRLQSLGAAVDAHLAATANASEAPTEWRKLIWFHLAGDRLPDALVVLRTRRDECAAAGTGPKPCKALILAARPDGGYRVVTEFTLRVYAVALLRSPTGVRELFYTRDTGAEPTYARYRLDGEVFTRADGDITAAQLAALPVLLADDRNMPLWSDQAYAARQFANDAAWMAPFRLHFDASTMSETRMRGYNAAGAWYGDGFDQRAQQLAEALLPDARELASALPWPQTLELRLWSCVDWMVDRRFWEVEDRRLGRPGACIEPTTFAQSRALVSAGEAQLDIARLMLLQQVGLAYVFRVAPWSPSERMRLRQAEQVDEARFVGATAGLFLGHARRLMTLDRAGQALDALGKLTDLWFNEIERGRMRFVTPTPELRGYVAGLAVQAQALQCVKRALGQLPHKAFAKVACDTRQSDVAKRVLSQLQEDMKR